MRACFQAETGRPPAGKHTTSISYKHICVFPAAFVDFYHLHRTYQRSTVQPYIPSPQQRTNGHLPFDTPFRYPHIFRVQSPLN